MARVRAARWTRRRVLAHAAGGAVGVGLLGVLGADALRAELAVAERGLQRFVSRPDLVPPFVTITTPPAGTAPGYVMLTPAGGISHRGPLIVDDTGAPVFFRRVAPPAELAIDLRVQHLAGEPVLTWWEGVIDIRIGVGVGEFVVVDRTYREVARVRAAGRVAADQHDLVLTPEGTAVFFVYERLPWDLSPVGGPADGQLWDCVVQEVDLLTGVLRASWRASEHVDLTESYAPAPKEPAQPYDFFHANSVSVDTDGHLLVSARHTWAVYQVHRRTGAVNWRLGGKAGDFTLGEGAAFSWQHDARRRRDGTLGLFDNGAGIGANAPRSRGLVLALDMRTRSARRVAEYPDPRGGLSFTQGGLQELPDGGAFVGWGQQPAFSEFTAGGAVRFEGRLPEDTMSYRAYRFPWTGRPADPPAVAVRVRASGGLSVHASWNGATDVATWRVNAGARPDALQPVASAARHGFETVILLPGPVSYLTADALDRSGAVLGSSPTMTLRV